jgi:arginase family enzyme
VSYILNPSISWRNEGETVTLELPFFGVSMSGTGYLRDVCDRFSRGPRSAAEVNVDEEVVATLANAFVLLREEDAAALRYGLLTRPDPPLGTAVGVSGLRSLQPNQTVLFDAPVQTNHGLAASVAFGGRRVREHLSALMAGGCNDDILMDLDLQRQAHRSAIPLMDAGEIVVLPEIETPTAAGKRVSYLVDVVASKGCRPLALGGDHSITYYIVDSLRKSHTSFNVVQFDAHHDLYTSASPTGWFPEHINHANVFRHVLDMAEVRCVTQIGLRDIFRGAPRRLTPTDYANSKLHSIPCRAAIRNEPNEVFSFLDRNVPVYISFDVDVLEGGDNGGTGTPVIGGLPYWSAFELMSFLFEHYSVVGIDFVEIGSQRLGSGSFAGFAARMIMLLLFMTGPTEPLSGYEGSSDPPRN